MWIVIAVLFVVAVSLFAKGKAMKSRGDSSGEAWILGAAVTMFIGAIALLGSGAVG